MNRKGACIDIDGSIGRGRIGIFRTSNPICLVVFGREHAPMQKFVFVVHTLAAPTATGRPPRTSETCSVKACPSTPERFRKALLGLLFGHLLEYKNHPSG